MNRIEVLLTYAVFTCPKRCKEPGMNRLVEERVALFDGKYARPIRKNKLPICSVCGSRMKKTNTRASK